MKKIIKNKNLSQEITWLLNEKYKGIFTRKAEKDVERIREGEPVDYVIGYKKFLESKIDLRFKPLIPRDETEFWVERTIESLPKKSKPYSSRFLDIFAGSGCIGIAVLKHLPNSYCDFIDIDSNSLKQIRLNLKINRISPKRYRVIKSDIFSAIANNHLAKTKNRKSKILYHYIFANPPYIDSGRRGAVQKSVLAHEPQTALFSKDIGLFYIKKLLQQAGRYLSKGGIIYMEFDPAQKEAIASILRGLGYKKFSFHRDQFGKWRFCIAQDATFKV